MALRAAAKPGLWTGVVKLLPLVALGWVPPAAAASGEPLALPSAREPQAVAFGPAADASGLAVHFPLSDVAGNGVAIAPRVQGAAARALRRRRPSPRDRHHDFEAALACVVMLLPLPPPSGGMLRMAYFMLWMCATRLQAAVRRMWRRRRRRARRFLRARLRVWYFSALSRRSQSADLLFAQRWHLQGLFLQWLSRCRRQLVAPAVTVLALPSCPLLVCLSCQSRPWTQLRPTWRSAT